VRASVYAARRDDLHGVNVRRLFHKAFLPENNARSGFLTARQTDDLLAALRETDQDVADMTELMLLTGCRLGNAIGARWSWFTIEEEDGAMVAGRLAIPGVETKNGEPLTLGGDGG
jgi:integrase